MEIGQKLKEARETLGLSLETVEHETKIRRKYLQALENEQFDLLPGEVYAKAFLKNYTKFLNLDVGEVMAAYNRLFTREEPPEKSTPKRAKEPVRVRVPGKPRYWIYLAAFFVLVGLAISLFYSARGLDLLPPAVRTREEVRREPAQTPLQTGEQTQVPEGQQTQAPGQQAGSDKTSGVNLVLNVKNDRSWIRVIVDGNPAFQGEVPAGQTKNFFARDKIAVTLGNAGVVEVLLNEQNLGYLGSEGAVVYREFIPPRG